MRDVTLLSMKNKSVHNCRFVQHAKFHCIMTTLNKLFKFEFESEGENWKKNHRIFCAARNFFKKQADKSIFGNFLENFDQEIALPRVYTSKISIY